MDSLQCPKCGTDIAATGVSSSRLGKVKGASNDAQVEHMTCPNPDCGAKLQRSLDDDATPGWQLQMAADD